MAGLHVHSSTSGRDVLDQTRLQPHIGQFCIPKDGSIDKFFLDWIQFKEWLNVKYSKHYARLIFCYSKRYFDCFYDVKKISFIPETNSAPYMVFCWFSDHCDWLRDYVGFL